MTKAQALATLNAMEAANPPLPGSAVLAYPGGVETWSIQLDPVHVYTGAQLVAIGNYCAQNGLSLTAEFSALGIT